MTEAGSGVADEKWNAYPETVLEFQVPGTPRIDLRKRLGEGEREMLRRIGLSGEFAVLTAENPCGENAEDEPTYADAAAQKRENAGRRSHLEAELKAAGLRYLRVDGVAPDGEYREHGVAVEVPRENAVALGRRLRQLAIFWFDGRDFWLDGAVLDRPSERLPR